MRLSYLLIAALTCLMFTLAHIDAQDQALHQQEESSPAYPSPDGKWTLETKWFSTPNGLARGIYVWGFRNNRDRKLYDGNGKIVDPSRWAVKPDDIGARYITALWSNDSHFVLIDEPIGSGRFTHFCNLYRFDEKGPTSCRPPWKEEDKFIPEMLRGADIKRADGHGRFRVFGKKWFNANDLEIECDLQAHLKATEKEVEQWVLIDSTVTIRFDKTGEGRIIKGHYDRYEKRTEQPGVHE